MTWLTATHPIAAAMETLIEADGIIAPVLQGEKVYNKVVNRGGEPRPRPYVVLAFPTEEPANTFGKAGWVTTWQIHLCTGNDNSQTLWLYNELLRLFAFPFVVVDHVMVQVTLRLIGDYAEENNDGNRAVVECTVRTLAA